MASPRRRGTACSTSPAWLEQKRREEGKSRSLRNYPLSAEEAFAAAGEPYFAPGLLEAAQQEAMP